MKNKWKAVGYRSPKTGNKWVVYEKPTELAQTYIDSWVTADSAKFIWLMQRRVGEKGSNYFQLMVRDR